MSCLIVAGFHRSGTSAVARTLALAGLTLGEDLLGSEPSNPYGHFEDNEVIAIHQTTLEVNGFDWKVREPFDPYVPERVWRSINRLIARREATGRPWGFKDPRVCLFLKLWLHALPEAKVLVVYRRPADVIRSLHKRHSRQLVVGKGRGDVHRDFWIEPDLAARMWATYHEMLLATLPPERNVHFLDFADRDAVVGVVETVNHRCLGLDQSHPHALDPALGVSEPGSIGVRDAALVDRIDELWAALNERSRTQARRSETVP